MKEKPRNINLFETLPLHFSGDLFHMRNGGQQALFTFDQIWNIFRTLFIILLQTLDQFLATVKKREKKVELVSLTSCVWETSRRKRKISSSKRVDFGHVYLLRGKRLEWGVSQYFSWRKESLGGEKTLSFPLY